MLSLGVGIALLGIKFFAYFLTGSAAIFSDALESIVNVAASGVAMYALVVAHSPADEEHPYGHGKIEFLSAHFEGGMILLAAICLTIAYLRFTIAERPRKVEELSVLNLSTAAEGVYYPESSPATRQDEFEKPDHKASAFFPRVAVPKSPG